eukprot:7438214-Ditylum_brightwellii.AAC.1
MAARVCTLGKLHWHKFCHLLSGENNLTPYHLADLAVNKIMNDPVKLNAKRNIDVIFIDEFGHLLAQLVTDIDTVLKKIRASSAMFGGVLVLCTHKSNHGKGGHF